MQSINSNSSKAGAFSLNVYESVGYQNEIVIVIVINSIDQCARDRTSDYYYYYRLID